MTKRGQRAKANFIDEASFIEDITQEELIENKMEILTTQKVACDVIYDRNNQSAIDFKGYGILIDGTFKGTVEVEYKGEIGQSDFEIISVKGV